MYGYWDIVCKDVNDVETVIEQKSLCTQAEADKTASAWAKASFDSRKRFFARETPKA